ncbi:RING-type E3 ubiquitin transferase [Salvia divinorum]|uniref:E3 ubiquitin-protein ligase RMA n=1 Tax=Salvia divinorum TaxID=28513 RepID=A0ABD1I5H9_SALDI
MHMDASVDGGGETAGFECNICFGLAQDPVITRCGHLHCWPCLYEWLRLHSQCHECPVCKAVIRDEELIPLNGRGDTTFHRPRQSSRFMPRVVRVRLRDFSGLNGYGSFGGGNEEVEDGNINADNMKKIMFFILLFLVLDFLII